MASNNGLKPFCLRVLDSSGGTELVDISSITLGEGRAPIELKPQEKKQFIKCPACEHHDWRDGIFATYYECDSCEKMVEVVHC